MNLAEVHTLYDVNASDVPAMLRQAADSIAAETEDEDRTTAMVAVQITESGAIRIYGWGKTEKFHSIGALTIAATKLADCVEDGGVG